MNIETIVGTTASVFTGIALLPQLVKVIREKNADGISYLMLMSLFIGLSCWIWYGIIKHDPIIIISNAFSLLINLTIFILSIRYKKHSKNVN
jgi:MtN3 and saliva related transmembrane protein